MRCENPRSSVSQRKTWLRLEVALCIERGDTLLFLYVVDLHFLDKTAAPIVVDVGNEVTKMGQFLLLMAQERAAERGVAAETTCRKGVGDGRCYATTRANESHPAGDSSLRLRSKAPPGLR